MSRSKQELLQASRQVKGETLEGANTADRVGGILYDITEHIQDVSIISEYPQSGTEIAKYYINGIEGKLFAPNGGGGEPGDPGYQRVYFTNAAKTDTVSAPQISQYQIASDTFVDDRVEPSRVWDSTNHNPDEDQFTYAIWVYFDADGGIVSIDGPVNLMNGGGTNGEDGEEIEWIYLRRGSEYTPEQKVDVADDLATYNKNGDNSKAGKIVNNVWTHEKSPGVYYTWEDEDVYPQDWTDNPQGVENTQNGKYEYAAFRRSTNVNGNRTWGSDYFHGPLLWSAYGKQGIDGDGVEYIFYADSGGNPPSAAIDLPQNWMDADPQYPGRDGKVYQDDEYIARDSRWEDNPIDLDDASYGPGSKQWVSMRKKQVVSPNTVPTWQSYSAPALWSGVGAEGVVDGYTISTDNLTRNISTDEEGRVDSYTTSVTYEVFHNASRVPYTSDSDPSKDTTHFRLSTGTITRSDNLLAAGISATPSSASSANTGEINITMTDVDEFDSVTASIPVVVHLPNGDTRNSMITLVGMTFSEGGEAVSLYVGATNIRTDYLEQNVVPQTLNIGVRIGKGSNPTVYYSGYEADSAESKGYNFIYYYDEGAGNTRQQGPITVATSHSSITVEMYKNNYATFLESLTLPYVKDGEPGVGIAAVNYSIAVLATTVSLQNNTVTGDLRFKVYKTKGGESPLEITSSPFIATGGDGETVNATINGATTITLSYSDQLGCWSASYTGTYNSSYPFSQIYVMSKTPTMLASTTVPIIRDGSTEVQGLDAVVMRFRSYEAIRLGTDYNDYGDIQNGTTPFRDGVIYKDIVIFDGGSGDNSYYYIAPSNIETRSPMWAGANPPATFNPYAVGSAWVHFTDMGNACFQALLAKYAYIENLTAAEIVITDSQQNPVAGMTRGSGTGIYPSGQNPIDDSKRGDVRIWAGYNDGTANLYDSKFYVTEGGHLHAEDADITGKLDVTSSLDVTNPTPTESATSPGVVHAGFDSSGNPLLSITGRDTIYPSFKATSNPNISYDDITGPDQATKNWFCADGSARLASGNLVWDEYGNVTIQGYPLAKSIVANYSLNENRLIELSLDPDGTLYYIIVTNTGTFPSAIEVRSYSYEDSELWPNDTIFEYYNGEWHTGGGMTQSGHHTYLQVPGLYIFVRGNGNWYAMFPY